MPCYICSTCGTQYDETAAPPTQCPVCEDDRQYIGWDGQQWTTLDQLRATHRNKLELEGPGLVGIGTEPSFAIGQRALHVAAAGGAVLWDCITLVDDATVAAVQTLGPVTAIAISHPHYYATYIEWSRALGGPPVYLHAADAEWVRRRDKAVVLWEGETLDIGDDLTLIRCGGHFPGGTVLHWRGGAEGRGAILSGDILQVGQDRRTVSFMYSFPNSVPLNATAVRQIAAAVEPFAFEQIYGAWWGRNILRDAKGAVRQSVDRYLKAIAG